ncbi:MAG: CBS domain-containing protein [Candidatus Thermoplasmatota archaeon]|nr:CBS domain-containing protein [Candidatus Thermoplasmatota archaeon]
MKIEDVMSKELIVGYVPGTVKVALKILAKHNVSGMPILKKDTKNVVGVLTRSDIFRNHDEDQLALFMTKEFESVKIDQDVKDAAKLLYEHRIHGLPVLNNRNNLVGIISPTDILKKLPDEIDEVIEHYFTSLVVPVYQETPINIIMEIISVTRENALPVLDDDRKLCGIVTDGDLFKLSHIKESVSHSDMGMGGDEDEWTWEGIRDTVRLHYTTSEVALPPVPVKQIMVGDVIKATKNTPIHEVAEKMIKNKISNIPVVDSDNRLLGMVTDIDLMACWF